MRNFGIVRWSLAANADMAAVAFGAEHRKLGYFPHARIAFVEIEGNDLGIAVDA